MSKLYIDVKTRRLEFKYVLDYELLDDTQTATDSAMPSNPLHFHSETPLRFGSSEVYRGSLKQDGDDSTQDVVCKIVEGDISVLKFEAELYDTLLYGMQEKHVPAFLGYFTGTSQFTNRPLACILLRYCGRVLGGSFWDQPIELKKRAMHILLCLHAVGVCHNDWGTHNMVIDDEGTLRVVNFSKATRHDCELTRPIDLYELALPRTEVPCSEVYDAALRMEIFTPSIIDFMGFGVFVKNITCPEDLVKLASTYVTAWTKEDILKEAKRVLWDYEERYRDRFTPVNVQS